MTFKHFVLTRFNLPLGVWQKDKHNHATNTAAWLEQRVELFKTYCLPTMTTQSTTDFIWIVLFWDQSPEYVRQMNEELKQQHPFYVPCYLSEEQAKHPVDYVNEMIKHYVEPDTQYVLTTRMDNDDALAVDAIEEIQRCAQTTEFRQTYIINLLKGIQYYPQYNISLLLDWKENHYCTMVEKVSDHYTTVNSFNHVKVYDSYPVVLAGKDRTMWMEVCHGSNVSNDVHTAWALKPLRHAFECERFRITPPIRGIAS